MGDKPKFDAAGFNQHLNHFVGIEHHEGQPPVADCRPTAVRRTVDIGNAKE